MSNKTKLLESIADVLGLQVSNNIISLMKSTVIFVKYKSSSTQSGATLVSISACRRELVCRNTGSKHHDN